MSVAKSLVREKRQRWLHRFGQSLADLVFPRCCILCERQLDSESPLLTCPACIRDLCRQSQACGFCSATLATGSQTLFGERCVKCVGVDLAFSRAHSLGDYARRLREVVIEIKHSGQEALAFQMGRLLGSQIKNQLDGYELVTCLPSFWTRHVGRGVNVAAILAEGVGKEIGLPVYTGMLKQTRPTKKQGTLTRRQRFKNVKSSFCLRRNYSVENRNVLLVDDVMTSGATVNEATQLLVKNGATKVGVAVLARSIGTL